MVKYTKNEQQTQPKIDDCLLTEHQNSPVRRNDNRAHVLTDSCVHRFAKTCFTESLEERFLKSCFVKSALYQRGYRVVRQHGYRLIVREGVN